MTRSHPPTLITLTRRVLREHHLVERGQTILVAMSGGPDSTALLHVLTKLTSEFGIAIVAHGVDHGLRSEAREEMKFAAALAQSLGVTFSTTKIEIMPGGNLQARARQGRYAALETAAKQCSAQWIATGHHADDRAETVLIRLLQGSGPRGLACLPPCTGNRIRPFLLARRQDILAHCRRHGLVSATDPSNIDPRFLRSRIRHELLPLLESMSPGVVNHLTGLADDLIDKEECFSTLPLRRAHRAALRRALMLRRSSLVIRLAGGIDARFDSHDMRSF